MFMNGGHETKVMVCIVNNTSIFTLFNRVTIKVNPKPLNMNI